MSTSAESAQMWLDQKKPSLDEVKSVLQKLEDRIENWNGDEEAIQGSIDAAVLLQTYVQSNVMTIGFTQQIPDLDTESLIPDSQPVEMEESIKRETFAALKAQLGKPLK